MAVDTLDISILIAIVAALVAYFAKDQIKALLGGSGDSLGVNIDSRDIVEVLQKTGKKAAVFYGSQTGTAEDYAHKFAKELQSRYQIATMCVDLQEFDFDTFARVPEEVPDFKLAVFFMATYGEGEATDNAVDFFEYINTECESLEGINYTCFGLGNSTYEFYNASGKNMNKRFQELGAELVAPYGEGDDGAATMDEDYLTWKEATFDSLKDHLKLEEHEVEYQPLLKLIEKSDLGVDDKSVALGEPVAAYVNASAQSSAVQERLERGPFDHSFPYIAPIIKSKELFQSDSRHCIHAEFDISATNIKYSTGDHLLIWPSNSNENVEAFLKLFSLYEIKDEVFSLEKLDPTVHIPFPLPTTYEAVVRHFLEISGPVSRQFLQSIQQFAPSPEAKELTKELADSSEKFHDLVTAKYLNMSEALLSISGGEKWSVPFTFLIESIQHLQPRYYSISSSSLSEKKTIHITAVVENEVPLGSDHAVTGVATNLLWNIQLKQNKDDSFKPNVSYDLLGPRGLFSNYKLPVHVRRSTFKLPTNPATPVIMVGPGTGVAPFRGFIRERVLQVENGEANIGQSLLFFGSRSEKEDFLYKDEWVQYLKVLGNKFQMVTAFSRDQLQKVYVQHKMIEYAKEINDVLAAGGFFYICGDAGKMAKDVNAALVQIFMSQRGVSQDTAAELIRALKTSNRFQEDVW